MLYGETAKQARDNVKNDLRNNVPIVSPDDFRKSSLPLDEDFDHELEDLKRRFYNKRWKGFPDPLKEKDPAESKFYGPFVNIAQAVSDEHEEPYSYIQLLQVGDNIFRVDDKIHGNDNLHPRTHIRVLMKKHGYSLRYFVDNFELVTVLRDAVKGESGCAQIPMLTRYL